jgi:NhaP-type Na+/H+ or K+/H+ antiporter
VSIGNSLRLSEGGKFAVKNVRLPVRHLLVAESASNDGLAYPFLSISIYLATEASLATALQKWIVISWLCAWIIRVFLLLVHISRETQIK